MSVFLLAAFTVVWDDPGKAQQTVKVHRIGILNYGRGNPALESFRRSLRDLGYVEAQNIVLEYRWAKNEDQLAALAAELLRVNVDIIVATNPRGSRVAQKLTKSVPIIVTAMNDPVGFGLVKSLHRPGGNVTGLSFMSTELDGKRLELLAETIHGLSSVGILAAGPQRPPLKELHTVASTLNVQLQVVNVNEPEEIENVLRAVSRHAGALQVLSHACSSLTVPG